MKTRITGCIILLLPFFFNSPEAEYSKTSITTDCTKNTSCIKKTVDEIPSDDLLFEEPSKQDFIHGFPLILP